MKQDFQTLAQAHCIASGLPNSQANVDTIRKAMEIVAAEIAGEIRARLKQSTDELIARREKANAPQ